MSFILAKVIDFSFYKDYERDLRDKNNYFVKCSDERAAEFANDYADAAHDEDFDGNEALREQHVLRAEAIRQFGVYELILNEARNVSGTSCRHHCFLASELEIVDEAPAAVIEVRYIKVQRGGPLGGYDKLGTVHQALEPTCYYKDQYCVRVADNDMGIFYIINDHFQLASLPYELPTTVIAKVDTCAVGISSTEKIVMRLLKDGKSYLGIDGLYAQEPIKIGFITLCLDNELEKWQRFLVTPRKLMIENTTAAVLLGVNDEVSRRITQLTYEIDRQTSYTNCYFYLPNGPDYLKADEQDMTKVSFLPANKVSRALEKGEDPYASTMRVSVTWAKMAQSMFIPGLFTPGKVESFHNAVSALAATEFGPEESKPELLIVRGPEVATYYSLESYAHPRQGELWSSCMRGVDASFFGMYVENPNQVGLLISRDRQSGKIYGRGLTWTTPMGTFLDRVYSNTQIEQKRMQNWADKQGYVDIWNGKRGSFPNEIKVTLESPYHHYYPYMDSMAYLNPETHELANQPAKGRYEVRSTGGDRAHAGNETHCYASSRLAPKSLMKQTVSKQFALEQYLKPLRTGGLEIEQHVVKDELVEGFIAVSQSVKVKTPAGLLTTLQSNPDFVYVASARGGEFYPKADCAYSVLDKAFILKKDAVLMPDGTYTSPAKAGSYKLLLLRRQPNKARIVPQVATIEELVTA